MIAHTQGPWRSVGGTEIRAGVRIVAQVGPYDDGLPESYKATSIANARLIVAAPELLEILIAVEESGWLDSVPCGPLADRIRAAIAKATGEGDYL